MAITLTEYEKLKDEQAARISARDSLLNFNVVALGALGAIGISLGSATSVLLFAPWVAAVFGWAYVQHEQKISAIGRYIKDAPNGSDFPWESLPKYVVFPKLFHSTVTTLVLILAFAVPCFAGPAAWFILVGVGAWWPIIIGVFDILLGVLIGSVLLLSVGR